MFRIRTLIALSVLALCIFSLHALSPEWLWAVQTTGAGGEYSNAITTDSQGNQYITGWYQLSSVFGDTLLTSAGQGDIFVAKLDASGNWLWAVRAGGSGSDSGIDICVDGSGNIFVTGSFRDTASFGNINLTSLGNENIFVAKLDSNGNWLWAAQAGSIYGATGRALDLDSAGNIIVTGSFSDVCHFGNTELTCEGMNDLFVANLSPDGTWQWAVRAGAGTYSVGSAVAVDASDNIFVAGETPGAVSFGDVSLPGAGGFIAKLSSAGAWQWAVRAGGPSFDPRKGLAVDNAGNVYLSGSFYQDFTFGSTTLTGSENGDSFVAKLSPTQAWLWAKQVVCTGTDYCHDLAMDSQGNIYIVGEFYSTRPATFGSTVLTGNGEKDIFAAKLDANGNWLWAKQAGGSSDDEGNSISVDNDNNAYLTGCFWSAAIFYPHYLVTQSYFKSYVAKLSYWVANDDALSPALSAENYIKSSPNPFHSVSQISYRISQLGPVELGIYNLKGQKVCSLVNESKSSGDYCAMWNGCDTQGLPVASGVYICRLQSHNRISSSRLVLIK